MNAPKESHAPVEPPAGERNAYHLEVREPLYGRSMNGLDLDSPEIRWWGALWYWAACDGDMSQIVARLRDGVPIDAESAAWLADILEGKVRPRRPGGGPSVKRQAMKRRRDAKIRQVFRILLEDMQTQRGGKRRSGKTARAKAIDRVAALTFDYPPLPKRLTAGQVEDIIESRPKEEPWQPFIELIERRALKNLA